MKMLRKELCDCCSIEDRKAQTVQKIEGYLTPYIFLSFFLFLQVTIKRLVALTALFEQRIGLLNATQCEQNKGSEQIFISNKQRTKGIGDKNSL